MGTVHKDQSTFFIISLSVIFRMRTFQTKIVEKIETHFVFDIAFCVRYRFTKIVPFMRDNVENTVEPGRPQLTIWCVRIARWIPKSTSTHSECVMLIAFARQQWLHERALIVTYTYIACLVLTNYNQYSHVRLRAFVNKVKNIWSPLNGYNICIGQVILRYARKGLHTTYLVLNVSTFGVCLV
jgi:hypothetical protein